MLTKDWQTFGLTLACGCYAYGAIVAELDFVHRHKLLLAAGYLLAAAIGAYSTWRIEARCTAAEKALQER